MHFSQIGYGNLRRAGEQDSGGFPRPEQGGDKDGFQRFVHRLQRGAPFRAQRFVGDAQMAVQQVSGSSAGAGQQDFHGVTR